MIMSFSELWENAEKTLGEEIAISSPEELIKEASAKFNLYSLLSNNNNLSEEDKLRFKTHTFGKILLALTKLSAKDNVNVFIALKNALDDAKIEMFEEKYK